VDSTVVPECFHSGDAKSRFNNLNRLHESIEEIAHLLPAQGPITAFVHHNTLHALENLPFDEAVVKGAETFGCHPYLPEERYRQKLVRGRILPEDIETVLIDDLGEQGDELLGFLGTRFHLRMAILAHPLRTGPTVELRWVIAETDALRTFRDETPRSTCDRMIADTRRWVMRDLPNDGRRSPVDEPSRVLLERVFERFDKTHIEQWDDRTWEAFTLNLLWLVCREGVQGADIESQMSAQGKRHRNLLLQATGQDSDHLVHDVLIRFCAAFIDQGFAEWTLPDREAGFYQSFLALYGQSGGPMDRWMRGLPKELRRLTIAKVGPLESIAESLDILGVEEEEREEFMTETLLALRGYAGMIWQLETRGDRAVRPLPAGSLVEFLAIRLILDRLALVYLAEQSLAYSGPIRELRSSAFQRNPLQESASVDQRAFLVFQLAQLIGWHPQLLNGLSQAEWRLLLVELDSFSGLQRRRIYHLAFERRYRVQALDAVAIHSHRMKLAQEDAIVTRNHRPSFHIVCCIDEREESFRRHLEEVDPACETLGAAGFFAVAINYRGAADAHYTPLCPVMIKPQHYVVEDVVYTFAKAERQRRRRRHTIGTVTRRVHVGSRTFAGGWIAAALGPLASLPLVTRILFPRATARLRRLFGAFVRPPVVTKLQLERSEVSPGPEPGQVGYSVHEMAVIVERLLRDIGLTKNFSRLVILCGHGSSSMNNPHEAAHDCGACAGGRGGPNARAFSQMANDPRVRELVAKQGLTIPNEVVFLGGYHNTCDDSITFYDLERLPVTHKSDFEFASAACDLARQRSAHERCRRFESAELQLSTEAALRHVEGRAEDLSQVRPEYGHATNSLCFVGRRQWSRDLFLDRRAFMQSYEPDQDDEERSILTRILQAVIPVCAGINLEYYFSYVDPTGYGCGTKLPHNITALLGVMNGAASDLRTGLPWQMVEIHEPVRLLFVIETSPAAMLRIIEKNEDIAQLVRGSWVQLATLNPSTSEIQVFSKGTFSPYTSSADDVPEVSSSIDWYRGWRDHLGFASIISAAPSKSQSDSPCQTRAVG
jgi:uncharacterized protein YbcC (UPF0753/DUF2309 family)